MPKQGTWKKIYAGYSLVGADGESILSVTEYNGDCHTTYAVRMAGEAGTGKHYKTLAGAKRYAWKFAEDVPFKHEYEVIIRSDMDGETLARVINLSNEMECPEVHKLFTGTDKPMEVVWQA
jgi:hypothetical protein